jgi:hypothetical protein
MADTSSAAVKSTPDSSLNASTAPSTLPTHIPGMPKLELPSHRPGGQHGHDTFPVPSPPVQRLQPPLSPHHRSTVHALGYPIHNTRIRSLSTGNYPYPHPGSPALPTNMSPYSVRSLPASPIGAPLQPTSGGGGLDMPFLPTQEVPPEHSETHKAMEAAAVKERARTKKLEEEETELDAVTLRGILKRERARMCRIAADLAAMKSTAVQSQLEAEVIEEGRINCLMRRLDTVQQEKGRIIVELEREEEMVSWLELFECSWSVCLCYRKRSHSQNRVSLSTIMPSIQLTNTLQKKLDQVRREKALLEEQIEHEKKSHATLQTQLSGLRDSHLTVAEALEEEEEIEEEA